MLNVGGQVAEGKKFSFTPAGRHGTAEGSEWSPAIEFGRPQAVATLKGLQCDMGPGKHHNAKLYDEHGKRGFICTAGQKVTISADRKKEVVSSDAATPKFADGLDDKEWHDYVIIAKGHHLQRLIDGHLIIDCTDEDKEHAALTGVLGFQIHAGHPMTGQFKDVEIKRLD